MWLVQSSENTRRGVVRRPPTDTAFPPIPVNAEHGYVAPVSGFPVGALLADNTADWDVGAIIRVSLLSERSENIRAGMRHDNDMKCPEYGSLGRRDVACVRWGELLCWGRGKGDAYHWFRKYR